jgi:4-hydroxybenzoate polyprenyltransferase
MVPVLLVSALALGAAVGPNFLLVLIGYYLMTLSYSLWFKRQMMIDVVMLACLYGIRLVAGAVAAGVPVSAWLAAFSLFLFCSLAVLKRCTELIARMEKGPGDPAGRDYQQRDLPMLEALAAASGFTSIMVFALYLNSDAVKMLYHSPSRLSLLCIIMIYWIGRVLLLAHRGQMHDDPVVFAATDKTSLACVAVAVAVVAASL